LATRHRVAVAGIVCPLIRGCVVRGQEHYSIGWRAQGPKSDASQIEALAEFLGADADHLSCAKPIADPRDWLRAIGPPGKARRPTALSNSHAWPKPRAPLFSCCNFALLIRLPQQRISDETW